ncbi:MAG TPA: hypothetical protein VL860_12335, partial [Planctomycetota bacterium]|nr:hypothetical protein [Planctomycetota bacterium]
MHLNPADAVFLSIDIQPRRRELWTQAKVLEIYQRPAFTVEELNGGMNHFFDVALPNAVRVADAARAIGLPRVFVHWAAGCHGLPADEAHPHADFRVQA